jgi:hypothetical protein
LRFMGGPRGGGMTPIVIRGSCFDFSARQMIVTDSPASLGGSVGEVSVTMRALRFSAE